MSHGKIGPPLRRTNSSVDLPPAKAKPAKDPVEVAVDVPVVVAKQRAPEVHELGAERRNFKLAFGLTEPTPPDPLATDFAKGVLKRMKDRWAHDRSAAQDQITGTAYSAVRTQELADISGDNYLARQYGMRTAKNRGALAEQPGLRVDNPNSAVYNRDFPADTMKQQCEQLYETVVGAKPAKNVYFMNSASAATRYEQFFPDPKPTDPRDLGHGVYAVTLDGAPQKVKERLAQIGATPSGAEVMKRADANAGPAPVADAPLGNAAKLAAIAGGANPAVTALENLPPGHAMKQVAGSAAALLKGLGTALAAKRDSDAFEKNPLIDNALRALDTVVRALPTMAEDSRRFFATYEAMLDEIYIVLAAAKPYGNTACKDAAGAALNRRAPVLATYDHEVVEQSSYLVSSGMDALTTGWQAAAALAGTNKASSLADRGERDPDYFEVGGLVKDAGLSDKGGILTATLNPSLPRTTGADAKTDAWDADVLIDTVAKRLTGRAEGGPLVLLLDITVEKESGADGKSELDRVLAAFKLAIEAGQLKLVMAKSYQKYPSLGSGKVMAGSVTVLAAKDDATTEATTQLDSAEKSLAWMQNDESQLLAHFLTEGADSEVPMIAKAAANAKLAQELCTGGKGWANYQEGLPFVLVSDVAPELASAKGGYADVDQAVRAGGADWKDSFAFLNTSYLPVPLDEGGGFRVTLGQESPAEVVEKLWGVGTILNKREAKRVGRRDVVAKLSPGEVVGQASLAIEAACNEVGRDADLGAWAETALRVIERAGGKPGGLRTELARVQKARAKGAPEPAAEADLRLTLRAALNASGATSKNPLKDQLEVVASAFPVVVPDRLRAGSDPDAMRAGAERTWQGPGAPSDATRYTPNIIASCLNLLAAAFGPEDVDAADLAKVERLYEAAIANRLEGVSPGARSKIIAGWTRLQKDKLADPTQRNATLRAVADTAGLLPSREDKAKLLRDQVPDEAVAFTAPAARDTLIDALFAPLDADMRERLIADLVGKQDYEKAKACIDKLRADLQAAHAGAKELVRPDRLTGGTANATAAPVSMTATEIDDRLNALDRLEAGVVTTMGPDRLAAGLVPKGDSLAGFAGQVARWAGTICAGNAARAKELTQLAARIEALMAALPAASAQQLGDYDREIVGFGPAVGRLPTAVSTALRPVMHKLLELFYRRQRELRG